jgi:hypothetical protein
MRWIWLFITFIAFASCRKEPTIWGIDYYGPVAEGTLDLTDIFADSTLMANEENVLTLSTEIEFEPSWLDTLSALPDTIIRNSFDTGLPFSISVPPGVELITIEENNSIGSEDIQLREVRIKEGTLNYTLINYIDGVVDYNYTLPGALLNGQAVSISGEADPGSANEPSYQSGQIDLRNSSFDLTGSDGFSYNEVTSVLVLGTSANSDYGANLVGYDSLAIELSYENVELEYAKGYFGQYSVESDDIESLEFMNRVISGSFQPEQISLGFNMENTAGVDIQVRLNEIMAINSEENSTLTLNSEILNTTYNLSRAIDNNGDVQSVDELNLELNELNSNVIDLISLLPDQIGLVASLELNPLGDISSGNDFYYADKPLLPVINIDFPFCFSAGDLTLRDTLKIEDEIGDLLVDGELILKVTNSFPFGGALKAEIINANGEVLHNLIDDQVLPLPETDIQGFSAFPGEIENLIGVNQSIISDINPENSILLTVVFDTGNAGQPVKVSANDRVEFKLNADLSTEISVE